MCDARSRANKGKVFSKPHRDKLSAIAKTRTGEKNSFYGHTVSEENKKILSEVNSKPVGMYDKITGELLQVFPSLKLAGEFVLNNNLTQNPNCIARISKICNGMDKSAYGYIWKYM